MPIFWRYLFSEFFKIFTLSLLGLIACLLMTRLQEIAYFATLADDGGLTLLFTLYQIPYILPFAIPISSLIASTLLFQKLSLSHELTALRASGLSLKTIKVPLKFFAFFLALTTFLIVSELTPITRNEGHKLLTSLISSNPLLLLEKNKQLKVKNSYIDIGSLNLGKEAKDVILVLNHTTHLSLMTIESLEIEGSTLKGHHISYITSLSPSDLMIENQESMEMEGGAVTPFLTPHTFTEKRDHLPLRPLLQQIFGESALSGKSLAKAKYELMRRFFFPLLTITFMFLGMSFGSQIGRKKTSQALKILALASYSLLFFLASKSQHTHIFLAALCILLLPHLPLLYLAKREDNRINQGLE